MLPSLKGRNRTVFGVNSGEFIADTPANQQDRYLRQNQRIMHRTSKSFRVSQK